MAYQLPDTKAKPSQVKPRETSYQLPVTRYQIHLFSFGKSFMKLFPFDVTLHALGSFSFEISLLQEFEDLLLFLRSQTHRIEHFSRILTVLLLAILTSLDSLTCQGVY